MNPEPAAARAARARCELRRGYLAGRQARLSGDLPSAIAELNLAIRSCGAANADRASAAHLFNEIGLTLKYWGTPSRSLPLYRRAQSLLGGVASAHPLAADLEHNIGGALHSMGALISAEAHARRAVRMRRRSHSHDLDGIASDEVALAGVLVSLDKSAEASRLLTAAIDRFNRTGQGESTAAASAMHNLAALAFKRGDTRDALSLQSASLAIRVAAHGAISPYTLTSFVNMGHISLAAGHRLAARAYFERALETIKSKVSLDHPAVERVRAGLAAAAR